MLSEDAARIRVEEVHGQEARSDLERGTPPPEEMDAAVEYARRLFESVMEWYGSADTKAQVVLTIDGAFLAFLTGSIFAEPADLAPILSRFTPAIWLLLALMSLCLTGSIACALLALWSRLHTPASTDRKLASLGVRTADASTYAPEAAWFFQLVRRLDREQFARRLATVDRAFEVRALAAQIHALSANVAKKHFWVNCGFVLAGCSLVLFLGAGVGYLASL